MRNIPQTITADQQIIETEFQTFERAAETDKHIYFGDSNEGDDNGNTLIYWKESLTLLSDNYFASCGFLEDAIAGIFTWVNPEFAEGIAEMVKNYEE